MFHCVAFIRLRRQLSKVATDTFLEGFAVQNCYHFGSYVVMENPDLVVNPNQLRGIYYVILQKKKKKKGGISIYLSFVVRLSSINLLKIFTFKNFPNNSSRMS